MMNAAATNPTARNVPATAPVLLKKPVAVISAAELREDPPVATAATVE